MRILIVCGAGASSTFVAHRVRRAAKSRGLDIEVLATSEAGLDQMLDGSGVLLLGSHLAAREAEFRTIAGTRSMNVAVMPESVFNAPTGDEALDLALQASGVGS